MTEPESSGKDPVPNNLSSQVSTRCSVTTDLNEPETLDEARYCGMTTISGSLYEDGILWRVFIEPGEQKNGDEKLDTP